MPQQISGTVCGLGAGFLSGCFTVGCWWISNMFWKLTLHVQWGHVVPLPSQQSDGCFCLVLAHEITGYITQSSLDLLREARWHDGSPPALWQYRGNPPSSSSSSSSGAVNTNPLCLSIHLLASPSCFLSIFITRIQPVLFYHGPTPCWHYYSTAPPHTAWRIWCCFKI